MINILSDLNDEGTPKLEINSNKSSLIKYSTKFVGCVAITVSFASNSGIYVAQAEEKNCMKYDYNTIINNSNESTYNLFGNNQSEVQKMEQGKNYVSQDVYEVEKQHINTKLEHMENLLVTMNDSITKLSEKVDNLPTKENLDDKLSNVKNVNRIWVMGGVISLLIALVVVALNYLLPFIEKMTMVLEHIY